MAGRSGDLSEPAGGSPFNDNYDYYDPTNPLGSVMVPHTGTQIRVKSVSTQGSFMQMEVKPVKIYN